MQDTVSKGPVFPGTYSEAGPRVALFTDSFREVNGVARTSREFARYAGTYGRPMLSVHIGPETRSWTEGTFRTCELKSSPCAVPLETDLAFDLFFVRHYTTVRRELQQFRPDILHVTGPGHIGLLGAILAWRLRIPLVASWHTNVHQFGARRLGKILGFLPGPFRRVLSQLVEQILLGLLLWFYQFGEVLFAPNPELVRLLETRTKRTTYLMRRGIDLNLFSPLRRTRCDRDFVIGYVGRLSPEKNVRVLAALERQLISRGTQNYRFHIIGEGSEGQWLAANLRRCEMIGVLLGAQLADAYANMDVFVFPSETDTFGNVVLEALSSGVPTLVSTNGGPKYIIRPGVDGFEGESLDAFAERIIELYRDSELRERMSQNARQGALLYSWDAVFTGMYESYERLLTATRLRATKERSTPRSMLARL